MANQRQLAILERGVRSWNRWRADNPRVVPDFRGASLRNTRLIEVRGAVISYANLRDANLRRADFHRHHLVDFDFTGALLDKAIFGETTLGGACFAKSHLTEANFMKSHLYQADFSGARLKGALFYGADLEKANLRGLDLRGQWLKQTNLTNADMSNTILRGANLRGANLQGTDLRFADLRGADLQGACMADTRIDGAVLEDARVYGLSVWNLLGEPKNQSNLVISRQSEFPEDEDEGDAPITVDNIRVAQFIYLLLHNSNVRQVIDTISSKVDTISSKVVLILGRFTPRRKAVLDALREELRLQNYVPVLFDFTKPLSRDLTETISAIAHFARFVIADITDAKSIPQELERIVPSLPSVPVQPLVLAKQHVYGMFEHFRRYPWVLEPLVYKNQNALIASMRDKVIRPAEAKVEAQRQR